MTARNYQQKLDLSRFGGGADSDEDDAPTPKIVLAAEKQNTFAYGIQRKSKKDREREEEKRKKEEEERDAARVFAEFTAEFEGEGSAGSSRKSRGGFVREGGSGGPAYEPPRAPAAYGRAPGAFGRAPVKPRSPSPPPASKPKGKRVINSFLEDLKRDQAAREDRFKRSGRAGGSVSAHAAWENPKDRGSHDLGDANTTNLFVGNLPQAVTDQSLGLLFAKLGPIGSVKVMYPRFEESSVDPMSRRVGARAGLSGFVAYMKRSDAERAVHDMDGLDWGGNILKVGWSKSVPIPARPIYDITSSSSRARSRSRSPLRHAKRQRSVSPLKRENNYSGRGSSYDQRPRSHSRSRSRSRSPSHSRNSPNLKPETEKLLKTVAAKVRDLGKPFEDMLREKERDNEKFNFLRDSTLPEYHFFRSLLNPRHRMPTPPPPPPPPPPDFVDEGYNSIYSTDSEEDSERERTRKGKLGKLARRRFVSCLRGLKGERGDIARCMAFALDHADSADEISDLIIQSLSIFETPVPLKVARLHLISDILSNSASPVPNAWKYRGAFEARLPAVFDHFGVLYSSFKAQMGRLSAEQFKSQITNVLDVLEIWIVFNPAYTDDLRVRLSGAQVTSTGGASGDGTPPSTKASSDPSAAGPAPSKFKKGGFSSSFVSDAAEQKEEEDLDGAPMGEDLDGAPLDDSLDGEPMGAEEEDLDGEAMEDVDGEPM